MFISPGEISRGQWIMIHSPLEKEKEIPYNDNPEVSSNPLGILFSEIKAHPPAAPHLVLAVQIPFLVVSNCLTSPCLSQIWRTDENNLIEVKDEFVKAFDPNAWHRGQKLLDPSYVMPVPSVSEKTHSKKKKNYFYNDNFPLKDGDDGFNLTTP